MDGIDSELSQQNGIQMKKMIRKIRKISGISSRYLVQTIPHSAVLNVTSSFCQLQKSNWRESPDSEGGGGSVKVGVGGRGKFQSSPVHKSELRMDTWKEEMEKVRGGERERIKKKKHYGVSDIFITAHRLNPP